MTLSAAELLGGVLVGNDAGWALSLHVEERRRVRAEPELLLSREQYDADVQATLPGGLEGGAYTIAVEGLTDADYAKLRPRDRPAPTVARLYLYWRDANASVLGYLANVAGIGGLLGPPSTTALDQALVAELAVTEVSRRVGARRYDTVIEAKERAWRVLTTTRLVEALTTPTIVDALRRIEEATGVAVVPEGFGPTGTLPAPGGAGAPSQRVQVDPGTVYRAAVATLGRRIEQLTGRRGRGMVLIRDGSLHVGPRPIPLRGAPIPLTPSGGLLAVEATTPLSKDPNFKPEDLADEAERPPSRRQFKVTLKGRPDLKPGDVVLVNLPPEETRVLTPGFGAALLGPLAGPLLPDLGAAGTARLYVSSVQHRLGRASGFSTVLIAAELAEGDDGWDTWTPGGSQAAEPADSGRPADEAVRAAGAIRRLVGDGGGRHAEVGEVRSASAAAGGPDDPPSRTETVWRGLREPDGGPNGSHRLPVRRERPAELAAVPQASPFAWGRCGLVLPRYPGTRVVLLHRNGDADDPVDAGALWEAGHGPDAQPGDWWLVLPVGVPPGDREALPDEGAPAEHDGKASNDLVDADGNRVIEVGELTVRVGRDSLGGAGTRPARGDDGAVTIEHADAGARIVIKQDGSVTIHAAADLQVSAGGAIRLAAGGDIDLQGANVNVQVDGTMDVR